MTSLARVPHTEYFVDARKEKGNRPLEVSKLFHQIGTSTVISRIKMKPPNPMPNQKKNFVISRLNIPSSTRSPRLDVSILSRRKHDLLIIKEAERSHNLAAVSPRQDNLVGEIQSPRAVCRLGQEDELKVFLAV